MAFLKRKRVKFAVDLQVCELCDVPLVNAVLFAKVRLLEGGNYEGNTERVEVSSHCAVWTRRFTFVCRIASDQNTGILESCLCRISIRKEQKGGKTYVKLGYVDINLSEFAASGVEGMSRAYLLDGYGMNQRQDNSKVKVKVTMCHQSADPVFKVPRRAGVYDDDETALDPLERRALDPDSDYEADEHPVAFRNHAMDVMEGSSTNGDDGSSENKISVSTLRRLSQDRSSAPRLQGTRIDADAVIASVLAGSRLSEDVPVDSHGLELYVGSDGEAVIAPPSSVQSSKRFERVHIAADNGAP